MENRRFRHLVCDILVLYLVSWEGSKCRNVGAFETKRERNTRTYKARCKTLNSMRNHRFGHDVGGTWLEALVS